MEAVIREAINDALKTLGLPECDFAVEHPKELSHGDYACNVAMVLGKQVGQAPRQVAEQLVAALAGQIEYIDNIEIAGPGFINFHLARDFFVAEAARAIGAGAEWGKSDVWSGKKVVVEYTDPNPFKEFHIGHLFTNAVGESIARLFMINGAEVKRVCYQGDVGLHVAYAIWGMQKIGITTKTDFTAKDLGKAYATGATAYKDNEMVKAEIRTINKAIYERSDEAINSLYDKGRKVSLAYFDSIYDIVGTEFDEYFFESEAGLRGRELVLNNPDNFPESDGARIFDGEQYGLHTRVFLNKEGLPTYEAKELALAKMKEERLGYYDYSVISTANEINEYFKVLLKAMSFVYPDLAGKTEHIGHGMVRLSTGKMSSRTGDVISALDFISEVADEARAKCSESGVVHPNDVLANQIALGAIKYATLRGSILQDSIFDKERALSFEGDSGPYLQYTHARALSVLEKAQGVGILPQLTLIPETSYILERILYRFPEVIEAALAERAPHLLVTYLTQLAGEFNTFYAHEKIADPTDKYAPYKVLLTRAVAITLKNGLWTLGMEAPEKM
jgi:arginyl-tRNA synthetase